MTAAIHLPRRLQGVGGALGALRARPVLGPALSLAVAYVLLVEVLLQLVFGRIDLPVVDIGFLEVGRKADPVPREIFVGGAVIGSLYALVGMGLILVHRANRIINFAQAQLGAVPAVLALLLIALKGWNYWVCVLIVIAGAVLLGAGVESTLVRRFSSAPRLILTVATIGIGFVLLVVELITKQTVSGDLLETATVNFPTPFQSFTFTLGTAPFTGDHIVTVVVVGIIVSALGAFFRFTDMGIAVRASAENGDRASLLGIPVKRVSTVVWVIATVMSAIGVFLRAPLVGIPLTGFVGLGVLLFGLAAAVMAGMESLPRCLLAGMFIGCVDRAAVFSTNRPSLAIASMLLVILVALLTQRKVVARAFDTGSSTWQAVKEVRPIPNELRGLPEVRRARLIGTVLVGGFVLGAPWILGDGNTGLATQMVILAIVGVSLVLLTGWAGQISLGQWGISGIGAAVAGGLAANHRWDFFATLVVAALAGAVAAVLIGLPALRMPGLFLAVTTLSFAFTVESFVLRKEYFGWLLPKDGAFVERPRLYGSIDLDRDTELGPLTLRADAKFYFLCLVFLGLALAVARALRTNRSGRIFIGARDNPRVMQAFGVNVARTKLAAFAISGALAAMAGALFAYQQRSVDGGSFPPETSILLFTMVVIGGVSSLPGAMLGAVFVKGVPLLPLLREIPGIELLSSGLGLLVLLLFFPGGLAEGAYRARDAYLRRVAERRGIHVPSLVADSRLDPADQPARPVALPPPVDPPDAEEDDVAARMAALTSELEALKAKVLSDEDNGNDATRKKVRA